MWAWGANFFGKLGDGTTTDRNLPVQVTGLSNVIAIAAGDAQNLALKSDGTVWTWGGNDKGQLGDGTTTERHAVAASGLAGVIAVAAGYRHSLALKSDGTIWDGGTTTRPSCVIAQQPSVTHRRQ